MRREARWAAALLGLAVGAGAWAQGREGGHGEGGREGGAREGGGRGGEGGGHRGGGSRAAPGPFRGHPPGMHPHGPMVRQHPVRVLPPRQVARGGGGWRHWNHPEFSRPVYYWDWRAVRSVTCVAEDSYGDQYPVSEGAGPGFGPDQMTAVEDDALDRCYSESGQDPSCYLATCSHF